MKTKARILAVVAGAACLAAAAHADTLNVAADAQTNSTRPTLRSGIDLAMTVCNTPICNLQAGGQCPFTKASKKPKHSGTGRPSFQT